MTSFGSLRLTNKSLPLLRGECTISLRHDPERVSKKTKVSQNREKNLGLIPNDNLWQALKAKRLELARSQGVPPYVIFHDSSLIEMHERQPKTLDEFIHISGVGQSKLNRYASAFIEVIVNQ